jgi:hypothetical protein
MPKWVQSRILRMMNYAYINFDVTVKNSLLMLQKSGFELREIVKVYHLGVMKLLPLAPAYIFITRKVGGILDYLTESSDACRSIQPITELGNSFTLRISD